MYVGSMKMAGSERKSVVDSGGMSTSWWGVQGTEDLGGGLKAGFMLGAFFQGDDGSKAAFPRRYLLCPRCERHPVGRLRSAAAGSHFGPNFLPSVFANPFGDSFEVSPLILHENVSFYNGGVNYSTTPSDTGWSNQIRYTTPDIGGLTINVAYQFGEVATANSKKNVGVNATYRTGGLMLTGFYERAQVNNPGAGLLADGTKQNWMLGSSYDFGVVKLYGTYGQSKTKDNDNYEGKTASLGLDIPVSKAGTIKAAVAHTKMDTGAWDGKHTTTTVGYDHNLSKRTDVYGVVMNDRFTGLKSGTSLAVGIRHRF
jgi:predicted porin